MQDRQLVRDYVAHASQAAFAQLVERHLALVYSACLREVHDAALAEDVTQVVFLILARKAPSLQDHVSLAGWLFRTARFACRNALRQEARRKRVEQKAVEAMREQQHAEPAWESLTPMLRPALASLNAREQEVVLLRFFEDRSVRETSDLLGISEAATKMRASRALDKLRRYFARQGTVLSAAALLTLLTTRASHAVPEACRASVLHTASTLLAGQMPALPAGSSLDTLNKGVLKAMGMNRIYITLAIFCTGLMLIGGPLLLRIQQSKGATSGANQDPLPSGAVVDHSLSDDPRLQQQVALNVEGVPVGDLLALLAKKTGVELAADEKVADDKIVAFGPARPLRD